MSNIISFKYGDILNNELFFAKVWREFCNLLYCDNAEKIYLDLRNIKFVAPLVLPKICCMGVIAARNGKELEMVIDANSDIKYYLSQVNFFDIVKRYNILTVDDGLTGGEIEYNKLTNTFLCFCKEELISKYEKIYEFNKRLSEKDKLKICIQIEIMGPTYMRNRLDEETVGKSQILSVLREFSDDYKKIEEIALDYAELIHNALWHGKTLCFFALQAGTYRRGDKTKFARLDVSVMDCGKGLYESLSSKDWKRERKKTRSIETEAFLSLRNRNKQNLCSIIEMILFRKNEEVRGIYDVMTTLVEKKKLEVLFINNNIRLALNNESLRRVLDEKFQVESISIGNKDMGFGMDISFSI